MKKKINTNDAYNAKEANRRFEAALRGAFSTPPTPMKEMRRKRSKIKRKLRKHAIASA